LKGRKGGQGTKKKNRKSRMAKDDSNARPKAPLLHSKKYKAH
jgi:hypothetical protein